MHRIEQEFKTNSPQNIEWVSNIEEADFWIGHVIGPDDYIDRLISTNKPYAILFHCFREGIVEKDRPEDYYYSMFKGASVVYSFHPLKEMGFEGNLVLGPWGVNPDVFYKEPSIVTKEYDILATGYVAETEGLEEIYLACEETNSKMLHIGGLLPSKYNYFNNKYYRRVENISDEDMRKMYNLSRFTSGLRRNYGFELPVIEGILCGSRPICFDNIYYRRWFNDFAIFIPEKDKITVKNYLRDILTNVNWQVTEQERKYIAEEFCWKQIVNTFWASI